MNSPQRAVPVRDRFYARTFALVTALVLGIALYKIVQPFFGPLLWAMFIAFLLYPLHVWLTRRLKGRAQLSAALLTVLTLIVLVGPLAALSAAFAAQVGDLLQTVQSTVADQTHNVFDLTKVPWIKDTIDWLDGTFGVSLAQIRGYVVEGSRAVLQSLASLGGKVFLGAFGAVFGFVLMVFLEFFFIRDGAGIWTTLRDLIPMSRQQKTKLFDHLAAVTRALVYGTGLTALIQGALVGIAFLIVGLPSALVFGVIAARCIAAVRRHGARVDPRGNRARCAGPVGCHDLHGVVGRTAGLARRQHRATDAGLGPCAGRNADCVRRRARWHCRVRRYRVVPRSRRARADHRAAAVRTGAAAR